MTAATTPETTSDANPMASPEAVSTASVRSRPRRLAVVGVVALVTLGACTSDPGPSRVARDIIEAEALAAEDRGESFPEECLLDVLDDEFSNSELEGIADDLDSSNEGTRADGDEALARYSAALDACLN